ncbi:MAG TPA: acriflavin resistance protein, partial [Gammaproteobacteria bacterium]|nr:acriflavin resistance protein [Gammaproteobacteria bacterium]
MSDTVQGNGIITFFARHKVAANLLMLIMLIAGALSLNRLNTQFFPDFSLDTITVRVEWRGASTEDVEESLTTPLEQELRNVDYIKKMTSTSSSGQAVVVLEFEENTAMGEALDQVKERVAQIR